MNGFLLYWRYAMLVLRAQTQYRFSFVMTVIGNALVHAAEFLGIWLLFDRFRFLSGWTLPEVAFFYGLVNIAFALAEAFGRGFDMFSGMVRGGDFDRLLLRPRGTVLQVAASELQVLRIGKISQGVIVLLWAACAIGTEWTAPLVGLSLFAIAGGCAMFFGLFVLQATFSFWSTESLELMNTVTYGGQETAQYPITIYRPWFRMFFTVVVPLACVTYFPALPVLGRMDMSLGTPAWFQWIAPLAGFVFLGLSLVVWRFGVRRYRSTGS